jgi:MFS family permease
MRASPKDNKRRFFGFGKNVFFAGLVSLLMDISSEMIYPLIPLFLANVLGTNKAVIGLIEGVAESTASILKIFSGWISDRMGNRKWLMVIGYGISTLSRPIVAIASTWHQVMGARFIDRFGKGIRTAPRDALIADSTQEGFYARAFSFHRAMDTVGAVIGPAIAFIVLGLIANGYRTVFWLSMIPGVAAVLVIIFYIRDKKVKSMKKSNAPKLTLSHFDRRFKFFVLIAALFAVGNSSDVFLVLRAQQIGVSTAMIPLLYLMFNLIYSASAIPLGIVADKFGKKRVIITGFILFAFVYYGFAVAEKVSTVWIMFGLYAIFMGLTEGNQKAFLATIIPKEFKATAYGVFNAAVGLAMLPASIIGGLLWDHVSPSATFYFGSITAIISVVLFVVFIMMEEKNNGK